MTLWLRARSSYGCHGCYVDCHDFRDLNRVVVFVRELPVLVLTHAGSCHWYRYSSRGRGSGSGSGDVVVL